MTLSSCSGNLMSWSTAGQEGVFPLPQTAPRFGMRHLVALINVGLDCKITRIFEFVSDLVGHPTHSASGTPMKSSGQTSSLEPSWHIRDSLICGMCFRRLHLPCQKRTSKCQACCTVEASTKGLSGMLWRNLADVLRKDGGALRVDLAASRGK